MADVLNVVEPTLVNEAGHCHSFLKSLCDASDSATPLRLWISWRARLQFSGKGVSTERFFFRRFRRVQAFFLYRRLLRSSERIFVSTAGITDLQLIHWAAVDRVPSKRVFLYVHWFNRGQRKISRLRKLATAQPNLEILAPTESVIEVFRDAGFRNVHLVPYPIGQQGGQPEKPTLFRHLLFAGAARRDKGFSQVVELVALLRDRGLKHPVVVQTSAEHYGKYDDETAGDIARLRGLNYQYLKELPATLTSHEYEKLFCGAVALQLYDPVVFRDRVSGVALDALMAGCPIVTLEGSWIATLVKRFDGGLLAATDSAPDVLDAVEKLILEYPRYSAQATQGGNVLRRENDARVLLNALVGNPKP